MIAIDDPSLAAARQPTIDSVRRGRMMFATSLLFCALGIVAALPPLGSFYPLLYAGGFFAPFFLVPWMFGAVHAFYAWRRNSTSSTRAAFCWWLLPIPFALGAVLIARSDLPHSLAFRWAKEDLTALRAAADALPEDKITLDDRWLGPWPAKEILRYPTGELRLELGSTNSWFGTRGLLWTPTQPPLPGRWQADAHRELGDGWFAWAREEVR